MSEILDKFLNLNAEGTSLEKASSPQPVGPGELWHKPDKSIHLPYYIQHIANALRGSGHSESQAIAIAVGTVRRWATSGQNGKHSHVDKNTRAAAVKALADWEAVKAKAKTEKSN